MSTEPVLPFVGYEKIVESAQSWQLDEAAHRLLDRVQWVVTEKIHGANFCLLSDGATVRCANRRQLLGPGDSFFGYQALLRHVEPGVLRAAALLRAAHPSAGSIAIYGELFGGGYPHPDVSPVAGVQPVQTGVWYAPDIEFCAFDIALVEGTVGRRFYLDYDHVVAALAEAGIFYAAPLLVGSYTEALDHPLGFDSTIPSRLGLPPLGAPNRAEGVVVKPLKTLEIATPRGPLRPVLKRKIAEFAEDRRFHQAQPWDTPALAPAASACELLKWEAYNLAAPVRVDSAISKVGYATPRGHSKAKQIFRLVFLDILGQLVDTHRSLLGTLGPREHAALMAYVQDLVRELLRSFDAGPGRRL